MSLTEINPPKVFLDANVLFKARLRDLFTRAEAEGLIDLHWSAAAEDEWVRNSILKSKEPERVSKVLNEMVLPVLHNDIPTWRAPKAKAEDYPLFDGVDPKDLHVASSAYRLSLKKTPSEPVWLVTLNTKDFPESAFHSTLVSPVKPGKLLDILYAANQSEMLKIAENCRNLTAGTPPSFEEYAGTLKSLGCSNLNVAYKLWKTMRLD